MNSVCHICRRPKANYTCEVCEQSVCKSCVKKLSPETFGLMEEIPKELRHSLYCGVCFDSKVASALNEYEQDVERAKMVCVFYKGQGEESRMYARTERPLKVTGSTDKSETLLRLAFKTVRAGFNALVDVEIVSEKVRNEGFQTTHWRGHGIPTQVDLKELERKERPGKILLPS